MLSCLPLIFCMILASLNYLNSSSALAVNIRKFIPNQLRKVRAFIEVIDKESRVRLVIRLGLSRAAAYFLSFLCPCPPLSVSFNLRMEETASSHTMSGTMGQTQPVT